MDNMLNEVSVKTNSRRRLRSSFKNRDRSHSASNQDLVMIEDNQSNTKPTLLPSRSKTAGAASQPHDEYNDLESTVI